MIAGKTLSPELPGFKMGLLLTLSPLALLFARWRFAPSFPWLSADCCLALAGAVCAAWCALALGGRRIARAAGLAAVIAAGIVLFPQIRVSPLAALLYFVLGTWGIGMLWEETGKTMRKRDAPAIRIRLASGGCAGIFLLLLLSMLTDSTGNTFSLRGIVLLISCLFCLILYANTARCYKSRWRHGITVWCLFCVPVLTVAIYASWLELAAFLMLLPMLPRMVLTLIGAEEFAIDTICARPLQLLLTTFLLLCLSGTLLLRMPGATHRAIPLLDAAFTAVSAVCVTGLVVLDTGKDFTIMGQGFILLLIQLGGLGIMGIASAAMYSLGRRISLRQEWVMSSLTDLGSSRDLYHALLLILKFTFAMEAAGAVILTAGFHLAGASWLRSCGEGVFTAVSAFCNAGFSPRADSLSGLRGQPLILYTVSFLIIAGGLTPAAAAFLPAWLRRQRTPLFAHLIFTVTGILLLGGFAGMLALEWNGVLDGMGLFAKVNNAWFQSATLRTAGFSSVNLEPIHTSTLLLMCFLMAVGGCPGGTAGGFKTVVLGVLALTFWNHIRNRDQVVYRHCRIPEALIAKSITIFIAYTAALALSAFMLLQTQSLPARQLLFETFSALGTVGLSLNATTHLDEIGRVIIILTMFVGRVGPISLCMLLNGPPVSSKVRYPDAKISLN